MKKNIFVLFLICFCSFNGVSADQVSCEKIENRLWSFSWGFWKTCFMKETTQINSVDTTIASRDESVQGLQFYNNKKVFFLPVGMSEMFPNLQGIEASSCVLTTVSKANFKGLSKLQGLFLHFNQIEKIESEVFDGLVALEELNLTYNKLKFINGKAFARLTKLTGVWLSSNQCINEDFTGPSRIAVLQQTVNEKCSFDELVETPVETSTVTATTSVSNLVDKKCEKSQDLITFANITLEGMKAETSEARSEVISMLNELKTQQKEECGNIVKALESQTKAFKDQQTYFNEALENRTTEIVAVNKKLAAAEMQAMLKVSKIQRLEEELQRKNEKIIENREKIKELEAKVEILSNGIYK